jgi:hypothetical protein
VREQFQPHELLDPAGLGARGVAGRDVDYGCAPVRPTRCNPRLLSPRDLETVVDDPSFEITMQRIELDRLRLLVQYRRAEQQLESLIGLLESELAG